MSYLESVDNALRLLSTLARDDRVSVTQAAADLGVAPSTAHRLLSTLRYRGFAAQPHGERDYVPGPALTELRTAPRAQFDLVGAAHPHMIRLQQELGETCHLMVRHGREVRFLASVESNQPLRVSSRAGQVMPAHLTSGGKLLLGELGQEDLALLYPASGVPDLDLDAAGVQRLHREVRSARRRGYRVNNGGSERGIAAVATCVRNGTGQALGAVSVSVPVVRYSSARVREILASLQRATGALSAEVAA